MPKKGYKQTKEHRANIKANHKGMKGKHPSKETKAKMSEANMGHSVSKETRAKISKNRRGVPVSKETRERYGIAAKIRWQNPIYKERVLRAIAKGSAKPKPTKPERILRDILNKLFPREYKYVGNRTLWIGCKNPDFVHINGQKKIIEMFGGYWHSFAKTGKTKHQEKKQRIEHFAKYNFKTLIVWQYELKNIKKLKGKLIEFHNR